MFLLKRRWLFVIEIDLFADRICQMYTMENVCDKAVEGSRLCVEYKKIEKIVIEKHLMSYGVENTKFWNFCPTVCLSVCTRIA